MLRGPGNRDDADKRVCAEIVVTDGGGNLAGIVGVFGDVANDDIRTVGIRYRIRDRIQVAVNDLRVVN